MKGVMRQLRTWEVITLGVINIYKAYLLHRLGGNSISNLTTVIWTCTWLL